MLRLKILYILLMVCYSCCLMGQNCVKLWGNKPNDYHKKKTILIKGENNGTNNHKNAIIFCPGGSYCYLSKKYEGKIPSKLFNNGADTYILHYRTGMHGNRYPAMIEDLQKAILYVRQNSNVNCVGVCGFSAGGHLVGFSAEKFNHSYIEVPSEIDSNLLRPDFVVMCYPVVTMCMPFVHKKSRRNLLGQYYAECMLDSLSLEKNVNKKMPPSYILVCKDDPIVDYHNSLVLDSALTANSIEHRLNFNDYGGHGFGVSPNKIKSKDKTASNWPFDFVNWIQNFGIEIDIKNK